MTERPIRDRLGEALRLALHHPGPNIAAWDKIGQSDNLKVGLITGKMSASLPSADETRENWRKEADRLLAFAPDCGLSIIEAPK